MSYSFTIQAPTKAAALAAVAARLDEIVAQQAVHKVDRPQCLHVAELFVGLLPDDDTRDVRVQMNGYVSGKWEGPELLKLEIAHIGINACLADRA